MIAIEILQLVDQLEALLNRSWRVPFSSNLIVKEQECQRILDQMRISIPEEIRQAKRTLAERDRLVAQAQEESQRILATAREQASLAVEDRELIHASERRAEAVITQAQKEAKDLETSAKTYALQVLHDLADDLSKTLRQVENGINRLGPEIGSTDNNLPATASVTVLPTSERIGEKVSTG